MYFKITDAQKKNVDEYQNLNSIDAALVLQKLSFNVNSSTLTAGSTGATTLTNIFVAPTKCKLTKATAIMDVVQTGTGNTPTVSIYNLTTSHTVAVSGAWALSGTIGDKKTLVVDTTYEEVSEGDVLQFRIINPTATITVALQAKVQMEWCSIA